MKKDDEESLQKKKKTKLYLDVDDVVFDTSGYLKFKLGLPVIENIYAKLDYTDEKVIDLLSRYDKMPLNQGFRGGVQELEDLYDLFFFSEFTFWDERVSKSDELHSLAPRTRQILIDKRLSRKYNIDLSTVILVDSNPEVLKMSNARIKIFFKNKVYAHDAFTGLKASNWEGLLHILREEVLNIC